jgi:hypothetical protein
VCNELYCPCDAQLPSQSNITVPASNLLSEVSIKILGIWLLHVQTTPPAAITNVPADPFVPPCLLSTMETPRNWLGTVFKLYFCCFVAEVAFGGVVFFFPQRYDVH